MPAHWENTLEDRKHTLEIPKGFKQAGEPSLSRKFESEAQVEVSRFERKTRVVESGALAVGTETRHVVTNDPGKLVFFTVNRINLQEPSFGIPFALTFNDGVFRTGSVTGSEAPSAGTWSLLHRKAHRTHGELTSFAELAAAFKRAEENGFTVDEIATAFGKGQPVEAIRNLAVTAVTEHADATRGRAKVACLENAAALDVLPGFTADDLGPIAGEIFAEEVEKTISGSDLPTVIDLVEKLTE